MKFSRKKRFKLLDPKPLKLTILVCIVVVAAASSTAAYFIFKPDPKISEDSSLEQKDVVVEKKVTKESVAEVKPTVSQQVDSVQESVEPQKPATETPFNPYSENTAPWYVYQRRFELGVPIGNVGFGSPCTFMYAARSVGLLVDQQPGVGAIVQIGPPQGYCVIGVVESSSTESFTMSTYAYQGTAGLTYLTFTTEEIVSKSIMFAH